MTFTDRRFISYVLQLLLTIFIAGISKSPTAYNYCYALYSILAIDAILICKYGHKSSEELYQSLESALFGGLVIHCLIKILDPHLDFGICGCYLVNILLNAGIYACYMSK